MAALAQALVSYSHLDRSYTAVTEIGGKGGALGCPSPGLGLIQLISHLDKSYIAVTEIGTKMGRSWLP